MATQTNNNGYSIFNTQKPTYSSLGGLSGTAPDRATLMKSLMGNPQTMGVIQNALNSPIGSTARQNLQSLGGIVSRTTRSAPVAPAPSMLPGAASTPSNYSNWVIFPNANAAPAYSSLQSPGTRYGSLGATPNGNPAAPQTPQGPGLPNGPVSPTYTGQPTTPTTQPAQSQDNPQVSAGAMAGGVTPQNNPAYEQVVGSPAAQYTNLSSALKNNMGPTAFAASMMNNIDALRQLPGFENLPDDALPHGASLSGQIEDLSNALRQQYNLDTLINQNNNLIARGVTLEGDLTDYIRGRDEFLNHTNGMLEAFKDKMLDMDLSDPTLAKQADQYMNYLYTLRGRQNKRYIEFLNSSVDVYNGQLKASGDNLSTALDNYQRELESKAAITTEEYNTYKTALQEMYQEAKDAPMRSLQMQQLQAEIRRVNAAIVSDAAKSTQDNTNFLKESGELRKYYIDDKTGNLLPSITSFTQAINNAYASGYDPRSSADALITGAISSLSSSDSPDSYFANANKYYDAISDLAQNPQSVETGVSVLAPGLAGKLLDNTDQYMRNYILSADNSDAVMKAAKQLTGEKGWFFENKLPSRDDFKANNSSLSSSFLDQMYNAYEISTSGGAPRKDAFGIGGVKNMSAENLAGAISSRISGVLAAPFLTY